MPVLLPTTSIVVVAGEAVVVGYIRICGTVAAGRLMLYLQSLLAFEDIKQTGMDASR